MIRTGALNLSPGCFALVRSTCLLLLHATLAFFCCITCIALLHAAFWYLPKGHVINFPQRS
jgi:hypothetical protein